MLLGIPVVSKNTYPQRSLLRDSPTLCGGHKKTMDTTKWKRCQFTRVSLLNWSPKKEHAKVEWIWGVSGQVLYSFLSLRWCFTLYHGRIVNHPLRLVPSNLSQFKVFVPLDMRIDFSCLVQREEWIVFFARSILKVLPRPPLIIQNPPNTLRGGVSNL